MFNILILILILIILGLSYYFYKKIYKNPPEKYITYEGDCSGLVNRKMHFELMLALSSIYNRTLIIPPPHNWPHISEKSNITDYFDIKLLRKKYNIIFYYDYKPTHTMNYNEYINYMNDKKFEGLKDINPGKFTYTECKHIYDKNKDLILWFFPACRDNMLIRMMGNYDAYFGKYSLIDSLRKDLDKFLKIKPELIKLSWKILNNNGIKNTDKYYSIHIRRNDFKHYRPQLTNLTSTKSIINYIKNNIPNDEQILIISDEKDPNFFEPIKKKFNILRLNYPKNISEKYIRIIDILSCVNSYKFIGTPLSTFSYFIILLRNQSKKHIVKNPLFLDNNFDFIVKNNNWRFKNGWSKIHPSKLTL